MNKLIKIIAGIAANKRAIDDFCALASFHGTCDGECDSCPLQTQESMQSVKNKLTNRLNLQLGI